MIEAVCLPLKLVTLLTIVGCGAHVGEAFDVQHANLAVSGHQQDFSVHKELHVLHTVERQQDPRKSLCFEGFD